MGNYWVKQLIVVLVSEKHTKTKRPKNGHFLFN